MGEMAEGILNGDFDEVTGEYIGEGDGYPRTFTRKASKDGVNYRSRAVMNHFPDMKIKELPNGGLNVYVNGGVLTVWWKRGKWTYSKKHSVWVYFRDYANAEIELIAIVEGLMGKTITVTPTVPTGQDSGTQQCIDHVLRKIQRMEEGGAKNNGVVHALKNLVGEFKQYL